MNVLHLSAKPLGLSGSRNDKRASPVNILKRQVTLGGDSRLSMPILVIVLFPCMVILLISLLFQRHSAVVISKPPTPAGVPDRIRRISEKYDKVFVNGCQPVDNSKPRANATFVVLARNQELDGVLESVKSIERHFNRWFNYPFVLLNDGEFNSTFKEAIRTHTSGTVEFGRIEPSMWGYPEWIDPETARRGVERQGDAAIMYGGMESYHHMCRFYSGFFYKHELLQKYEWYWRVEPEVKYFCDITYDPFVEMAKNNKVYGFTIAVRELKETVPNIFRYASSYMRSHNITSQGLWEMFTQAHQDDDDSSLELDIDPLKAKLSKEKKRLRGPGELPYIDSDSMDGQAYNMCHFWSNFEIARLDWFRSKEYEDYFQMMDRSGGFWQERWGDAPIHSLAAGALLSPSQLHYFRDIGYRHTTIQHCPANSPGKQGKIEPYYDMTTLNETQRKEEGDYWAHPDPPRENGVGCHCRCGTDVVEVEGKDGSCINEWVNTVGGWASP